VPPVTEELEARAQAWLAPIPGAVPAGISVAFEPEYLAVRAEIEKLDAPSGGAVDWKGVSDRAGELLRTRTKDLLLASILAHGLYATSGAPGLAAGARLLTGILDRYWPDLQPELKRLRARANCLTWFLDKTCQRLEGAKDFETAELEAAVVAADELSRSARTHFGDAAPAFGPLIELLERRRAASPPSVAAAASAVTSSASSASPTPAAASGSPPLDFAELLSRTGSALVDAARAAREAAQDDPTPYRILRVGLWLHLASAPPASGGRSTIPPPPEALRSKLELLAKNGRWAALLEEAESALPRHRFALDLQRATFEALSGLGRGHERAARAVVVEVRSLLGRMPELVEMAFVDGTPLASSETRAWLTDVILPPAAKNAPEVALLPSGEANSRLGKLRDLVKEVGAARALALSKETILAAPSGREKFLLRLELARACRAGGLNAVAKGLFEELAREAAVNGLDSFEPALAAEALKGLIGAARALGNDPRGAVADLANYHRRLCSLDPAAAQEVWP
jgi:type VI secretion system protein VasJ